MPDLNAGLLQISDLGNQIQMGRKAAKEDNQNLLNSIGGLYGAYQNGNDQEALNQALAKNFDPATGKLNQEGVIADMYAYKPQQGQAMAQQYQKQNLANQKIQSDLNKTNAETGKLGAETGKVSTEASGLVLKQQLDKNQALNQLVLGIDPNNPASTQKALQYAKSIGADTSLFDGIDPNNPASVASAKRQASGYLVQANDQIKNQIDQQNANSTSQNANSSTMNALTQQQVAGQNYEINTNKNNIDMYGKNIEANKLQNEIATKGMITPQQQVQNSIEISKANNDLQKEQVTQVNKIQTGINNLTKANKTIDLFSDNAQKILKSPLVSGGLDPKTGDILRDSTGKVVPNTDNHLGGIWGGLRTNDSTLNPFNKGSNEYKQLQSEYERLALQARGKGLTDLKSLSADGSAGLGGASDMEGKMLGVMQNVPDWEGFQKMNPQERVDVLDGIIQAGKEDKVTNNSLMERGKAQADVFSKQAINVATPTRGNSGQQANVLYNGSGQAVNLPTSMPTNSGVPPLRDQVYKAPNGYVLTPAMYDKIMKAQQGQ